MASQFAARPVDLIQQLAPSTYTDFAALGVLVLASTGYLLRGRTWDKPDPYHHLWFERPQEKDAVGRAVAKETRNIAQKLEESQKQLVVFWGSQSGTAEGFATRLARECQLRYGLAGMTADLSDYDPDSIAHVSKDKLAIFILSTFGEGDPSDNAFGLWEWIHQSSPTSLANLRYLAFGLGNSNYKYYNRVVDVVVAALDKGSAQALMPVGRADDATGATEEDFLAWKDDVFALFRQQLGVNERTVGYEPTLDVVEDDSLEPIDLHNGEPVQILTNRRTATTLSPVKAVATTQSRELFAPGLRNCLHIELDLTEYPEVGYKTGDHLGVWPCNPDAEVAKLLHVLGLEDRKAIPISIKSLVASVKVKVPTPTTVEILFRSYLEVCAPVSRELVALVAQFAPSESSRSFLVTLAKDRAAYAGFLTRTHVTLGRLLEVASAGLEWTALPLAVVIEALPAMQPRYYSISSSSVVSPRHPTITAVVSSTTLPANPTHSVPGLATSYLLAHHQAHSRSLPSSTLSAGASITTTEPRKIYAHVRKSKFKLPALSSQSIIMVAAGTGLAPFRGFIAERARMKQMGKAVGRMILFYGCRSPSEDYIYADELAAWQQTLSDELKIATAFSRQGPLKVYVQDRIEEERDEVAALLGLDNANLYICGSASMARDVGQRLNEIMIEKNSWSEEQAQSWAESRKRSRKHQEDVWG